jgi:hypothetical protein
MQEIAEFAITEGPKGHSDGGQLQKGERRRTSRRC